MKLLVKLMQQAWSEDDILAEWLFVPAASGTFASIVATMTKFCSLRQLQCIGKDNVGPPSALNKDPFQMTEPLTHTINNLLIMLDHKSVDSPMMDLHSEMQHPIGIRPQYHRASDIG